MDKRTFWTTKSPLPQYQTIGFEHPAFDAAFRLVANVFDPVTLGGLVYTPAPMTITPPEQSGNGTAKLTLSFPRVVVGREFKRQLRLIRASGSRAPIVVRYRTFLDDLSTPSVEWVLYASEQSGIAFGTEAVQVTATLDNPARRSSAVIYDPGVWTGLVLI